jgi:hypothetical protein
MGASIKLRAVSRAPQGRCHPLPNHVPRSFGLITLLIMAPLGLPASSCAQTVQEPSKTPQPEQLALPDAQLS